MKGKPDLAADWEDLARRQLAAYDAHRPGLLFCDEAFSLSLAAAYEIQRQVAALRVARGEPIAGYKIGCVSEAVQRQLGIDRPVFGHVFASELYDFGTTLDTAKFDHLAIEGEFGVRIGEDIPEPDWIIRHPERAVGSVLAVIELHNNVFRGATRTAAELIANNALHAGVVLPAAGSRSTELQDRIAVFRNGTELGTATAGAIPGGLIASLVSVATHLAARDRILRRGELVLTGSPLPLYPVRAGDSVAVWTERSGEVRAAATGEPSPR